MTVAKRTEATSSGQNVTDATTNRAIRAVTIEEATARYGLNRSKLYELMGAKVLDARKAGRRTIIIVASLEAYLAGLPTATIRAPRKSAEPAQPSA